jgi:hypothetical protein
VVGTVVAYEGGMLRIHRLGYRKDEDYWVNASNADLAPNDPLTPKLRPPREFIPSIIKKEVNIKTKEIVLKERDDEKEFRNNLLLNRKNNEIFVPSVRWTDTVKLDESTSKEQSSKELFEILRHRTTDITIMPMPSLLDEPLN